MQKNLAEGYQLHRAGKLKKAIQRYKSVLKISPQQPDAGRCLGHVERSSSKRILVDINPLNLLYLPLIQTLFP